jgi:hypothetical protein
LNKAVDAWRGALGYGVGCRELAQNVVASIKKVPRVRKEMATYTPEENSVLLRAEEGAQREPLVVGLDGRRVNDLVRGELPIEPDVLDRSLAGPNRVLAC